MSDRNYCVYIHTTPSGKVYIGITGQDPIIRWHYGNGYRHNDYFFKAIQKYGWENIKHEILFTDLIKEEAEQKEIELIKQYKSNERKFGYNIESGGNATGKISEQSKEKMRIAKLGKKLSEETKRKLSVIRKGRKLSQYNLQRLIESHLHKKLSEETKRKISEAHKGKKANENSIMKMREARRKEVGQYSLNGDLIKTFSSVREVQRVLGFEVSQISRACNGIQKTSKGYIWKYIMEVNL